jgi:hypothetical protein
MHSLTFVVATETLSLRCQQHALSLQVILPLGYQSFSREVRIPTSNSTPMIHHQTTATHLRIG